MSVLITEYVTLVNEASNKLNALTDEVANIEKANIELTRKLNEANELIDKRNNDLVEMQRLRGVEYEKRMEAENQLLVLRQTSQARIAELTAKLTTYEQHPDVVAAKRKQLEELRKQVQSQLNSLPPESPPPESSSDPESTPEKSSDPTP